MTEVHKQKFYVGDEVYYFENGEIKKATVLQVYQDGLGFYYILSAVFSCISEMRLFESAQDIFDSIPISDCTKESFDKNGRIVQIKE